jgi:flagellar motility protein MotE (MotC chaperone)
MSMPRILPLVGVAMAGVFALNALAGARALPDLMSGAKALAEEAGKPEKPNKAKDSKAKDKAEAGEKGEAAAVGEATPALASLPPAAKPAPVCAPTAAELAKAAGLSPAELQILQSLGARRGQIDKREQDLNVQLALLAAAEAKLDAKVKALNGLKSDINGLLTQVDAKEQAEIDRLVKVFEGMKAKDSAARMAVLDDSVRLPIAARMKERALSAMLAQMPANEAKRLTESLAKRFMDVKKVAAANPDTAPAKPASLAKAG